MTWTLNGVNSQQFTLVKSFLYFTQLRSIYPLVSLSLNVMQTKMFQFWICIKYHTLEEHLECLDEDNMNIHHFYQLWQDSRSKDKRIIISFWCWWYQCSHHFHYHSKWNSAGENCNYTANIKENNRLEGFRQGV